VNHHLLAPRGTRLEEITTVRSHIQALSQCRRLIRELGITPKVHADTAGAAAEVAAMGQHDQAAIASRLAAEIHGLDILRSDIEDAEHNTTRFLTLSAGRDDAPSGNGPVMTSFIFRVRNVPAALYKALGGFATNGVNMTKIESYIEGGAFSAAMFFCEVEGHPEEANVKLAIEELAFFSSEFRVLGTYPASAFRLRMNSGDDGTD
jgi:prephenate dehydratase